MFIIAVAPRLFVFENAHIWRINLVIRNTSCLFMTSHIFNALEFTKFENFIREIEYHILCFIQILDLLLPPKR